MEVVALPANRRPKATSAPSDHGSQADAGEVRPRPGTRAKQRLEQVQAAAFVALRAVSSYSAGDVELPVFFGRLSETVAGLVGAKRVAFWRLDRDRTLAVQAQPFGFSAESPIHDLRIRLPAGGESIVDRIIFRDEFDLDTGTSGALDEFWRDNGLVGLRNSIAVSWRAGDRRIGALVAYDARRGFTNDDAWVLRVAAMATGLMWQYREAEHELDVTVKRLEQAAAARRRLLGNVAAGGDEARRRFASALHDDSLQLVTAAQLQLERVRAAGGDSKHAEHLDQLEATLAKVEDSLRRLLINVSPAAVDPPMPLDDSIHARLEALRSRTGIEPDVDLRLPKHVPEAVGSVVLNSVLEAVANVEKHAHATRIRVSARPDDGGIRVVVADDGTGFVVAESMGAPGHLGLLAIRERAQLVGGSCFIDSEPGSGTRVEFWVPLSV